MPTIKKLTPMPALEPFAPFTTIPARLRTLFGEPFADVFPTFTPTMGFVPPVEIIEKGDEILVAVELPGMKKEDVEIVLHENALTIRGEKKLEKKEKEERENVRYLVYERGYGEFVRSFTLPTAVAPDKVNATFEAGMLYIHLPKTVEAKERLIPIGG